MQKETCSCGASMEVRIADGTKPYQDREKEVLDDWRNRHRCPNGRHGVRERKVTIENKPAFKLYLS